MGGEVAAVRSFGGELKVVQVGPPAVLDVVGEKGLPGGGVEPGPVADFAFGGGAGPGGLDVGPVGPGGALGAGRVVVAGEVTGPGLHLPRRGVVQRVQGDLAAVAVGSLRGDEQDCALQPRQQQQEQVEQDERVEVAPCLPSPTGLSDRWSFRLEGLWKRRRGSGGLSGCGWCPVPGCMFSGSGCVWMVALLPRSTLALVLRAARFDLRPS